MNSMIITSEENRLNKFPALFGAEKYKNMPLYAYAERLFYSGMDQMVEQYKGGYFDFVELFNTDIEIEKSGFIPMINKTGDVELTNHFGMTKTLSFKAASLVVWLYVIEQIASKSSNTVRERLYNTIQDIKYCYTELTNASGLVVFNEDDCNAIYQLLD